MVKWTPKAESDLDAIREYIAENFNLDLAIKIGNQIIDFTEDTLDANPLAGYLLESNPLFSRLVFKGNSIYYCENPSDRSIYIVYVQPRHTEYTEDRLVTPGFENS